MANAFKTYFANNIGTNANTVGGHTVAGGATETIIGFNIANIHTAAISVSAYIHDGTNRYALVEDAPVPVGSALVPVGGDQKIVLESGYSVEVSANTDASAEVTFSVLEQT